MKLTEHTDNVLLHDFLYTEGSFFHPTVKLINAQSAKFFKAGFGVYVGDYMQVLHEQTCSGIAPKPATSFDLDKPDNPTSVVGFVEVNILYGYPN